MTPKRRSLGRRDPETRFLTPHVCAHDLGHPVQTKMTLDVIFRSRLRLILRPDSAGAEDC